MEKGQWELITKGRSEWLPNEDAVLQRIGEALREALAAAGLDDALIRDPAGNRLDLEIDLRLERSRR